jgi:hypothetical protein
VNDSSSATATKYSRWRSSTRLSSLPRDSYEREPPRGRSE